MQLELLTLYTLSADGQSCSIFYDSSNPIRLDSFTFTSQRMGSASVFSTLEFPVCLDSYWTGREFVVLDESQLTGQQTVMGLEKYFLLHKPSSKKGNSDQRYVHTLEFQSERDVTLNSVYFCDAVASSTKYVSNNFNVKFFGTLSEFVGRFNAVLTQMGLGSRFSISIDTGTAETEVKEMSFEGITLFDALCQTYDTYGVPFYFVGNAIHFGNGSEEISTVNFEYGSDKSLLEVSKNNASTKIITRISGYGGSENIPYFYPNPTPKGYLSTGGTATGVSVVNQRRFCDRLGTGKTLTYTSDGTWTDETASGTLSWFGLSQSGSPVVGSTITQVVSWYITPSDRLMPSVYYASRGAVRFRNAANAAYTENGYTVQRYQKTGGGYYTFPNVYNSFSPREHIEEFSDIIPTLRNNQNAVLAGVAYDAGYNTRETKSDGTQKYTHFFVKIGNLGFNLFDCAIENQDMTLNLVDGNCAGCAFKILVDEITQKNLVQVDANGNLVRDDNGFVIINKDNVIPEQNDTTIGYVWLELQVDSETFGGLTVAEGHGIMPDYNQRTSSGITPAVGNRFVLTNITMPDQYYRDAEAALDAKLMQLMYEQNADRFSYSIKFSRVYLAQNPSVRRAIGIHSALRLRYNGILVGSTLHVSSYTLKQSAEDALPEISVELSDEIGLSSSSINERISESSKSDRKYTDYGVGKAEINTKRSYRQALEAISMLEGAFEGFTEGITPVSVQTMAMLVGTESNQFKVYNNTFTSIMEFPIDLAGGIDIGAFGIKHFTLGVSQMAGGKEITTKTSSDALSYKHWTFAAGEITVANRISESGELIEEPLDDKSAYYLYLTVPVTSEGAETTAPTGSFGVSKVAYKYNYLIETFEVDIYVLLVGIISSVGDGESGRSFAPLYGYTEILPNRILTDSIVSQDGETKLDLVAGMLTLNSSQTTPTTGIGAGISGNPLSGTGTASENIAAWFGGPKIDKESSHYVSGAYANSLFRFDGTGYIAGGKLSWYIENGVAKIRLNDDTIVGANNKTMSQVVDSAGILERVTVNGVQYIHIVNDLPFYTGGSISAGGVSGGSSPTGSVVSWRNIAIQGNTVDIAVITIDGTPITVKAPSGGAADYGDITGKPAINGHTLASGNNTLTSIGALSSSDLKTLNIQVNGSYVDTYNPSTAKTINITDVASAASLASHVSANNPHNISKVTVGLGNVENTALSTWAGSSNITTLGTVVSGIWNGTDISDENIASASVWNSAASLLGQMFELDTTSISGTTLIKAKFGLYSVGSISAGGVGSGGGSSVLSTVTYENLSSISTEDITKVPTAYSSKMLLSRIVALENAPEGGVTSVCSLTGDVTTEQLQTALSLSNYILVSQKGANGGVAELDASGKVPSSQLPSYVDDVLEYNSKSAFPSTGETGKIYIDKSDNRTYRWGGSEYVEISSSLALGETSSTAYRGDRGKAAYDHSQISSGNPHGVTFSNIGGSLAASQIPSLDASKITTGTIGSARLPIASASVIGGVKIGTNLSINSSGVLSANDTTYSSLSAESEGTAVSLVTTGEKYTWNNKQDALNYTPLNKAGDTMTGHLKMNGKNIEFDNGSTSGYMCVYKDGTSIHILNQGGAVLLDASTSVQVKKSGTAYNVYHAGNANISSVSWNAQKYQLQGSDAITVDGTSNAFGNNSIHTVVKGQSISLQLNGTQYALLTGNNIQVYRSIVVNASQSIKFDSSASMKNAYFALHPELGTDSNLLPFFSNDMSHLLQKGGKVEIYSTDATDYTPMSLNKVEDVYDISNIPNLFDASADYFYYKTLTLQSKVVIDIELPFEINASATYYIDFGNTTWSAKEIHLYATTINGSVYTEITSVDNFNESCLRFGYNNGWATYRRIRIVLSKCGNTNEGVQYGRISEIGVVRYDSRLGRETFMSRGDDDVLYRNLSPAVNQIYNPQYDPEHPELYPEKIVKEYNLGGTANLWTNLYCKRWYPNPNDSSHYIEYDSTNQSFKISGNLYATGWISAGGAQ